MIGTLSNAAFTVGDVADEVQSTTHATSSPS
jgi:hypothetical protein